MAQRLVQTAEEDAGERRARRVRRAAEAYRQGTAARISATQTPIHHALQYSTTRQGFALEVGRWPALQADLISDTWHVTLRNRLRSVFRFTFDSDNALLEAKNDLLEPLVANALKALEDGSERPADEHERGNRTVRKAAAQAPRATTPAPRAARRPARRPVMLAAYAIAFAMGFVFGPRLLLKSDGRPPMVSSHGHAVTQRVAAPKSHALPHARSVSHPQASVTSPQPRPSTSHP